MKLALFFYRNNYSDFFMSRSLPNSFIMFPIKDIACSSKLHRIQQNKVSSIAEAVFQDQQEDGERPNKNNVHGHYLKSLSSTTYS